MFYQVCMCFLLQKTTFNTCSGCFGYLIVKVSGIACFTFISTKLPRMSSEKCFVCSLYKLGTSKDTKGMTVLIQLVYSLYDLYVTVPFNNNNNNNNNNVSRHWN